MIKSFNKKAFSLVELMVALGIFVLASAAIIFVVLGSQSSQKISEERQIATQLAEEAMEAVRSIRDRKWNELKVKTQPYGLNSSTIATDKEWKLLVDQPETNLLGKFRREIKIENTTPIDPDRRKITANVCWGSLCTSSCGNLLCKRKVELVSYLTNWRSADFSQKSKTDFQPGIFENTKLIDGDAPIIKLDDLAGSVVRANEFLIENFTNTSEITTNTKISFRFTAQRTGTANNLRVYLTEVTGSRNYTIGLKADVSGNPHPTTWLCSATQPISSGNQWLSVTGLNCSLTVGTIYHLVIEPQ